MFVCYDTRSKVPLFRVTKISLGWEAKHYNFREIKDIGYTVIKRTMPSKISRMSTKIYFDRIYSSTTLLLQTFYTPQKT